MRFPALTLMGIYIYLFPMVLYDYLYAQYAEKKNRFHFLLAVGFGWLYSFHIITLVTTKYWKTFSAPFTNTDLKSRIAQLRQVEWDLAWDARMFPAEVSLALTDTCRHTAHLWKVKAHSPRVSCDHKDLNVWSCDNIALFFFPLRSLTCTLLLMRLMWLSLMRRVPASTHSCPAPLFQRLPSGVCAVSAGTRLLSELEPFPTDDNNCDWCYALLSCIPVTGLLLLLRPDSLGWEIV